MELNTKADVLKLVGDELRTTATELGVPFANNTGDKTIQKKIMETLGIADDKSEPDVDEQPEAKARPASKKVKIRINRDKDDKQPVPVAVNGRVIRIKRGEVVEVPEEYVNVLNDAVQVIMELEEDEHGKEQLVAKEVPAYNFSVLG